MTNNGQINTVDDADLSKMYYNIPSELQELPRWLLWRYELRDRHDHSKGLTKVPFQSNSIRTKASSTDEGTWSSFDDAISILALDSKNSGVIPRETFAGLGFCFDADGLAGIDLDGALDENEELDPVFKPIIDGFAGTYIEKSPSGFGLHIIVRCENQPFKFGHSKGWTDGSKKEVAFFFDGRYFTFTGDVFNGSEIKTFPKEHIRSILKPWINDPEPKVITRDNNPLQLDDEKIISIAINAKNGDKFKSLYKSASWGRYPSQSEADYALASLLAFYTRDGEQVQRIMEQSALNRDKWTKRPEYLKRTIRRAINGSTEMYGSWKLDKIRHGKEILMKVWGI